MTLDQAVRGTPADGLEVLASTPGLNPMASQVARCIFGRLARVNLRGAFRCLVRSTGWPRGGEVGLSQTLQQMTDDGVLGLPRALVFVRGDPTRLFAG